MTTTSPSPLVMHEFVVRYFEATRSNDAQRWASCFAPNAIVEDPVGTTPLAAPETILALGQIFMSAFETVGLQEEFVHVVGYEAAARWTGRGLTKEGKRVRFEGINVFTFDTGGYIVKLKGYWDPAKMIDELA